MATTSNMRKICSDSATCLAVTTAYLINTPNISTMPGNSIQQTRANRDLSHVSNENDDSVAAVAPSQPCSSRRDGGACHGGSCADEEDTPHQERRRRSEQEQTLQQQTTQQKGKSSLSRDYSGSSITTTASDSSNKENDGNNHNQSRRRKSREAARVSFHAVEIREYEQILGDHPCVDSGPPLTIGWNYKSLGTVPVDSFEKCCDRLRPLDEQEIILPRYWRETLLTEKLGYESRDVARAVREVNRVKCMRRTTYNNLIYAKLEEAAEGGKRALKKVPKKLMSRTRISRKTASDGETAGCPTVDTKYNRRRGKVRASVMSARRA